MTKVEVSDDDSETWAEAKLLGEPVRYAWRCWEHEWQAPGSPDRHVVMAGASDSKGRVQPMERDHDRRDAVISDVLPIEVEVR